MRNIVAQSVLVFWELAEAQEITHVEDCRDWRYRHGW